MNGQGRKLKKILIGKKENNAIKSLDEVVSALHKHNVFTNREVIGIILNRPGGLDLTYYSPLPLFKGNGMYVISIRKCENSEYKIRHYFEPRPDSYSEHS